MSGTSSKKPESFISGGWPDTLKIDPELETFFVAVSLELGRPASNDAMETAVTVILARALMMKHPGAPPLFDKLKRMYVELGCRPDSRTFLSNDDWFWQRIADLYASWLARQPTA